MKRINILNEAIVSKIAAGEVIERPASIVKELLENAIDAQATQITIEIKDAGRHLIKVTDDGEGMVPQDVVACIQKHATSKINNADDLFAITTLGFRGEALASMAAVAHLTVSSKQQGAIEGHRIQVEGGSLRFQGTVGANKGTSIEVKDLFFNTPARMKFLKPDKIELKKIIDIVTRYALLYHKTGFKLIQDHTTLVQTTPTDDRINTIANIYGTETAKRMLEINYTDDLITVNGYVSKPTCVRSDRQQQSFFVNKRYVTSKAITDAVYDAYHSLLFVGKHPIAVLNIQVDPKKIDVNVHPAKQEIKIDQEQEVKQSVTKAILQTLKQHSLIKEVTFTPQTTQQQIAKNVTLQRAVAPQQLQTTQVQTAFDNAQQATKPGYVHLEKLPGMRLLAQIHKTFFLAEYEQGLLIIDQHVVQERINYEKFMQELCTDNLQVQTLLQPDIIQTSPQETQIINDCVEQLKAVGYTVEAFGTNEFVVRTVPSVFGRIQTKEILIHVAEALQENKITALHEIMEEILTRKSCRSSIMAGDTVSIPEMTTYLRELDRCNIPYTCPHGRPVFIKTTLIELEKLFKRK